MAKNKSLPKQKKFENKKSLDLDPLINGAKDQTLRFRFDLVDDLDKWCLGAIDSENLHILLEKMRNFETMKIKEIFHRGEEPGKSYPLEAIISDAQARLRDRQLDDIDAIQRLNIGGPKRLYGILKGREFSVVWWDPKHEICPSPLKHT